MRTGEGHTAELPIGVISAVVVDDSRPGKTLLGVRRPSALATRHPGVLSTPTMRMPDDMFGPLSDGYPDPLGVAGMIGIDGPLLNVGHGGQTQSMASFVLEALFTRKLGLGGPIGDGRFHALARPRLLSLDNVSDPLGTARAEWTAMITYEVRIRQGGETLPAATESYSRLVWVDSAKVPRALATRDALLLDETLNAAEVCVQGLCVRVAVAALGFSEFAPDLVGGAGAVPEL